MRKLSLIIIFSFIAGYSSFAQLGLGLGSSGVVLKTGPDAKYGLIARSEFIVGTDTRITPQINGIRRFINEERTKLYGGVGLGAAIGLDQSFDQINSLFVRVPVGIEYFPFENRPISLGAEAGLALVGAEGYTVVTPTSLIEITFYLGKRQKD